MLRLEKDPFQQHFIESNSMPVPFRSKLNARKLKQGRPTRWPDFIRDDSVRATPHSRALAQRWIPERGFVLIPNPALSEPEDLLHRNRQLDLIDRNTRLFRDGKPANHALLWGARGTGKSAMVRAMLKRYGGPDLGMIEIAHSSLSELADLMQILSRVDRRYMLFIDDLSFDAHDARYKGLKALLDGSLLSSTHNVVVYATSNRRHLLPESMADNLNGRIVDGELHEGDAIDEKISLSERFGLWLAFHPFTQEQYLDIVSAHLAQAGSSASDTNWHEEALRFARLRGSRSGRVAMQFVQYWQSLNV
ncbi:ATP-binding protein [Halothiobacillus diazotrophicus]|nr:ATP-binding protein [Halothiobacillus diazotrophicus]